MILVKLGGSIITDKTKYRTFRADVVARLAREIRDAKKDIIMVHGAGSFGHVLAAQHKLQLGYLSPDQVPGVARVIEDVRELNLEVIRHLNREGVPSVSIPPSASAEMTDGKLARMDLTRFDDYLSLGLTPVTFGDVVLDTSRRFGICSGDQLMEMMARHFRPERIVFCTDVDGVFTADPSCDPRARLLEVVDREALDDLPRTQRCIDVTGSIYNKLDCMMRMSSFCSDAVVINGAVSGRLRSALLGEKVLGSKVVGDTA